MHPVPAAFFRGKHGKDCVSKSFLLAILCLVALAMPKIGLAQDIVLVNGSQWLNGQGVPVYKNTYSYPGPPSYYNNIYVGVKWQCVELAQRLYTAQGWHSGSFPGVMKAADIWNASTASGMNMTRYANDGSSGYVPVPGDMIIHGDNFNSGTGHVAVVNYVDSNNVYAAEQNASASGKATYSRSGPNGSILTRSGYTDLRGVIHSLNNHNTNDGGSVDPTNPYVDAGFTGTQIGTASNPFKTVAQAVTAASAAQATVHVKAGSYPEKITINKNIRIVTWGSGTVRIGG